MNPDPFEQNFGAGDSKSFQDFGAEGQEGFQDHPEVDSFVSSTLWGKIKNSFARLGRKFGYLKKPQPHPDVLHDFQDEEEYFEFECMTADDLPIMMDDKPVTVHQPEDCSQYFTKGQPQGHAAPAKPPPAFLEAARVVFKSNFCGFPSFQITIP